MPSSKRYKLRVSAWIALGVLLCCAITVGVSAVEPCERAVKRVITEVKWPHYSKATVARWVAWGKEHPNYVPPKRKPVVTTREVEDMMAFACESPDIESSPLETAMLEQTPDEVLGLDLDESRPYLFEQTATTPTVALLNVPVQQPTTLPGETPEPGTWLFLLTGAVFLAVVGRRAAARGYAVGGLRFGASA